jgi:hypothetical protein
LAKVKKDGGNFSTVFFPQKFRRGNLTATNFCMEVEEKVPRQNYHVKSSAEKMPRQDFRGENAAEKIPWENFRCKIGSAKNFE